MFLPLDAYLSHPLVHKGCFLDQYYLMQILLGTVSSTMDRMAASDMGPI